MASINQFRQLYVVNKSDDDSTFVQDKKVTSSNFSSKVTAGLYVLAADADTTNATSGNRDTVDSVNSNYYLINASGSNGTYSSSTKYFQKVTSLTDEVGEIEVNTTTGIGNGAIYFTYTGVDGKIQKSDFIEKDQVVSATAVNFDYLNKDKLIESATFTVNTSFFNNKTINGVNLNINIKNMGGQYKTSGIFPMTVFIANPDTSGPSSNAITAAAVKAAIEGAKLKDLGGNDLFTVTTSSNDVTITANPSGEYVRGKAKKFFPVFSVGMAFGDEKFLSAEPTYSYAAASVVNGDVAAVLEDEYFVERTNSGTIPYGTFPRTTESRGMVDPSANYSCIDIHYYKTNNMDFSQKSHGTITLLVKSGASGSEYTGVNALITKLRTALGSSKSTTLGDGTSSTKKVLDI